MISQRLCVALFLRVSPAKAGQVMLKNLYLIMKVGFASRWTPLDKRSWSGTSYYSYLQIKKYNEVEVFHFKWTWRVREWLTMQKSLNRKLFKKHTSVEFLKSYAKYFSRQLQKELKKRRLICCLALLPRN
jgi:hypothetical protein